MTAILPMARTFFGAAALAILFSTVPLQAQFTPGDNGTFVTSVYIAVLNRDPDVLGWIYWKGQLDRNALTRDQLTADFLGTPEYTNTGCPATHGSFLTCLYQRALNRAPDTDGFNYWIGLLNSGYTRVWVTEQFMAGQEFSNAQGSRLSYATAYVTSTEDPASSTSGSSGVPQQFIVHFANPYGYADIAFGRILLNSNPNGPDGNGACELVWDSQRNLILNSPDVWGVFGTGSPLTNANCSVDPARSQLTATAGGYDVIQQNN